MLTVEGSLDYGVEVDGVTHRDFVMAEPTIRDEVDAMDKLTKAGEPAETGLTFSIYLAAEQLQKLGDLDKKMINAELLMSLPQDDMVSLFAAQDEVKKKRLNTKKDSNTTTP